MGSIEAIERFLAVPFSGPGYGSGYGYGDGYGDGSGYGSGYGYGDGYGDGSGYGSGYGSGDGYGDGSGDGYDIKALNGERVWYIDGVPTLIDAIRAGCASGRIVRGDLTTVPCYVARVENSFAHGDTLRAALRDAREKAMKKMPEEERIDIFVAAHPDPDKPYGDLFSWHHILTGSCEMGRREWCKAHGLQPTDSITVRAFIEGTVNDYGGAVIRNLAERYNIETARP